MSKRPQTVIEATTQFRAAMEAFGQVIVEWLRLVDLCDWLAASWRAGVGEGETAVSNPVPDIITPAWVAERAQWVMGFLGDAEIFHGEEDALYLLVLRKIAAGQTTDPAGCAAAAIVTHDLPAARWYA